MIPEQGIPFQRGEQSHSEYHGYLGRPPNPLWSIRGRSIEHRPRLERWSDWEPAHQRIVPFPQPYRRAAKEAQLVLHSQHSRRQRSPLQAQTPRARPPCSLPQCPRRVGTSWASGLDRRARFVYTQRQNRQSGGPTSPRSVSWFENAQAHPSNLPMTRYSPSGARQPRAGRG